MAISAAISEGLYAEAGKARSQAISAEIAAAVGSQRSLAISAQLDAERDRQFNKQLVDAMSDGSDDALASPTVDFIPCEVPVLDDEPPAAGTPAADPVEEPPKEDPPPPPSGGGSRDGPATPQGSFSSGGGPAQQEARGAPVLSEEPAGPEPPRSHPMRCCFCGRFIGNCERTLSCTGCNFDVLCTHRMCGIGCSDSS